MPHTGLIIFDCDGVLINSEPIASRTLAEALLSAGIAISPDQALAEFTGHSEADIRSICADKLGLEDVEAVFTSWHVRLYEAFNRSLAAMPGIEDIVAGIDGPKCVASNSSMLRLERSLGLLKLWQSFAPDIFSAEIVARPKPAPDLMLYCADRFGVAPMSCIVIDDSPHGVEAARAAGMMAIGFVDPADPRPDRGKLLAASGACAVATGAAELAVALRAAERLLSSGPPIKMTEMTER